jgi:putative NIF3 family GTP cyclohydrolase 1 type 2
MNFEDALNLVKEKLNLKYIKFVKTKDKIKKIALTTGAGMSLLPYIKADLFLTGDIKYHEAMDAKIRNISLIDIGHYESEKFFVDVMYDLVKHFDVEVLKTNSKNPFNLVNNG